MRVFGLAIAVSLLMCGLAAATEDGATARAKAEQDGSSAPQARLIIRLDDLGFCHAANMALKQILDEGVCTSVSVIVSTPWLDEAVEILHGHPEVGVGVHLTLNAEWREYRWGPVLPHSKVPSLVDENGKFFGSRREFMAHNPKVEEVEKELRAQIDLALRKGLKISYVDYHMGTAMSTREFQEVVEKLAREYGLGISQYFGETYAPNVYRVPPEQKLAEAIKIIKGMNEPKLYLFVAHPGMNTPEMAAMTDLNPTGVTPMAAHRQAMTDLLCSPAFKAAIQRQRLGLASYSDLRAQGLQRMKRPWIADPYGQVRQP
ncbi:MAG: ChbG/HpnK family deacetylase [Phycisphaerae bacterium]